MKNKVLELCEKFIENRDTVRSAFKWENSYLYPVCAAIFLDSEKNADVQAMKNCDALLKDKVSVFSNFRGISKIVTLSMLSADENPEARLDNTLRMYACLKKHFFSDNYLTLAAITLSGIVPKENFDAVALRTREIYDLVKKSHPFLTSYEDSVFSSLLALSEQKNGDIITESERCYKALKGEFFSSNAVQSLSHVLALCEGKADEKCSRTVKLFKLLKENGMKYGTDFELATLGVLAMLPISPEETVELMKTADDYLATQKGYGFWGLTKRQRLMHAGMIVSSACLGKDSMSVRQSAVSGAAISVITAQQASMIAAQQAAMCAAIAASQAATSASN